VFESLSFVKRFTVVVVHWNDYIVTQCRMFKLYVATFRFYFYATNVQENLLHVSIAKRFGIANELFEQRINPAHVATLNINVTTLSTLVLCARHNDTAG
jgi:hypothetical protein